MLSGSNGRRSRSGFLGFCRIQRLRIPLLLFLRYRIRKYFRYPRNGSGFNGGFGNGRRRFIFLGCAVMRPKAGRFFSACGPIPSAMLRETGGCCLSPSSLAENRIGCPLRSCGLHLPFFFENSLRNGHTNRIFRLCVRTSRLR